MFFLIHVLFGLIFYVLVEELNHAPCTRDEVVILSETYVTNSPSAHAQNH